MSNLKSRSSLSPDACEYLHKLGENHQMRYLPYLVRYQPSRLKERTEYRPSLADSGLLTEQLPEPPSAKDPRPRVIESSKLASLQKHLVIHLTSASFLEEPHDVGRNAFKKPWSLIGQAKQSISPKPIASPDSASRRMLIHPLNLGAFKSFFAPYVPAILRLLINSIESYCSLHNWSCVARSYSGHRKEGEAAFLHLLENAGDTKTMEAIIQTLPNPVKILAVRNLLNELQIKPLNLNHKMLKMLSKIPILDSFLRPNPALRRIVQHAVLQSSAIYAHTLAFVMIHLLHVRDNCKGDYAVKRNLTAIYGRLVISFTERLEICGVDWAKDGLESALLGAIMEVCDYHFWNQHTGLKIWSAFHKSSYPDELREGRASVMHFRSSHFSVRKATTEEDDTPPVLRWLSEQSSNTEELGDQHGQSCVAANRNRPCIRYISQAIPNIVKMADVELGKSLHSPSMIMNKAKRSRIGSRLSLIQPIPGLPCRSTKQLLKAIHEARAGRYVQNPTFYTQREWVKMEQIDCEEHITRGQNE